MSKAKSLLQRVIFPRPGEPVDVRSLYLVEDERNSRRAHSPSRTSVVLGPDSQVSFEAYFNAFAAAYWRRWSILESVVLRVEVIGTCRIDLYRSKFDGARIGIGGELIPVDESGRGSIELEVDLGPFEDGGWIWFDLTTDTDTEIVSAGWYSAIEAPTPDEETKRVTVGIPTFNRPTDAVAALAALTSDPLVDAVVDAVLMPDQ
ncbi:MAG TPA: glycosyltransferase family 2 protein, partial [Gordonia sp. (in: high G+C Gram-positive bacteria)]|nr:glycosyltransferase family 2 protein [Gordonia sp. (in: high G+C Gram-positive bacteria)]